MGRVYRQTNLENLEQAFSVAEKDLGVTRLLDPEGKGEPRETTGTYTATSASVLAVMAVRVNHTYNTLAMILHPCSIILDQIFFRRFMSHRRGCLPPR